MATTDELAAMRQAIALSALGLGTTSPNPPVGCVILGADGRTVGAGFHQRKGDAHAETHALAAAGTRARGGTAVVTLEPCNHVGVTPACRQSLLDAGIARVVIAVIDPTSRGVGGAAVLADAGVDVEVGVLADEALVVLRPWLTATTTRRPHVTWTFTSDPARSRTKPADLAAGLRQQADLVVFDDRVEEGIPGGHGEGRLRVPDAPLAAAAAEVLLAEAFAGGARSILFVGDIDLSRAVLALNLVDRIVVTTPRTNPDRALQALIDRTSLSGFTVVSITAAGDELVLTADRRTAPALDGHDGPSAEP